MTLSSKPTLERRSILIFTIGNIVVFGGLILLAYLGFYNRYWSDDWCYNSDFKNYGVVKTTGFYFATGEEAQRGTPTDRYSLSLFSGLFYSMGVIGTQALAAITIMIWLASMYWILINISIMLKTDIPKSIIILSAGFLLFFNFYISTDRFQILYWRSGVISYSFAIIFGLITLGLITGQSIREKASVIFNILIGLTAFIAGGFSEIGAVYLFSCMVLILLISWWQKGAKNPSFRKAINPALIALIALILSIIVLVISPSNSRATDINTTTQPLLVPLLSLKSAAGFIVQSLKGAPLPHLIIFSTICALSLFHHISKDDLETINIKSLIFVISAIAIATFLLITAIQAPTTYLYSSQPDPRGQSLSRFTMTIGLGFIAWFVGLIISSRLSKKLMLIPIFFLFVGFGYTIRATNLIYQEFPGFLTRAEQWDARDFAMREAIANGLATMEVPVIDTNGIGTKDIMRSRDIGKWVQTCASTYYGFDSIYGLAPTNSISK